MEPSFKNPLGGVDLQIASVCGPLVASRPPGDQKNTTNLHSITQGPPPVSCGLRGAGFEFRFKKERAEVDHPGVYISRYPNTAVLCIPFSPL